LPCSANASTIYINCQTMTDLSAIDSAEGTSIYMHKPPCKLPKSFNSSNIYLY
jgi:hypothetical protein